MPSALTPQNISEVLEISNEFAKRADAQEKAIQNTKDAIKAAIPSVVEELVKYACVDVVQKDAVSRILSDHNEALLFIKKLAAKVATPDVAGVAVDPVTKKAFDNSNHKNHDQLTSEAAQDLMKKSREWQKR